jgi:hypothetical protein
VTDFLVRTDGEEAIKAYLKTNRSVEQKGGLSAKKTDIVNLIANTNIGNTVGVLGDTRPGYEINSS